LECLLAKNKKLGWYNILKDNCSDTAKARKLTYLRSKESTYTSLLTVATRHYLIRPDDVIRTNVSWKERQLKRLRVTQVGEEETGGAVSHDKPTFQ
jgi:hypothetical protein